MSNKLNSYQSIFANCLCYLTLVWSVFLFSGYVDSDYLTLPSVTPTELVEPQKTVKTTISFYENITDIVLQKQLPYFLFSQKTALVAYHQLQQVKFLAWTKKKNLYISSFDYLSPKTIPSASKKAKPALRIGRLQTYL